MQMSLMFHQSEAHMLGLCIIIYGASKICEPIYGLLCDHWVSSYGRRLPLLFLSTVVVFISLCIMGYSVLDNSRGSLFMCGFVSCMFAVNVSEVAYHGIIADEAELRPRTHGILSGYKTAWFIGGAACVQVAIIMGFSTFSIYVAQIISVPFFFGITAISMHVAPSLPSEPTFKLTLEKAADCYKLSPSIHGQFFWVIVAYFFASGGLQWERFLFFFARDCITPSVSLAKIIGSRAYLASLVACACGAICYSAFGCTRRLGNRRCFMISTFLVACATFALMLVETPIQLYVVFTSVGAFAGLMLSSSFALALEHIPQGHLESLRYSCGCLFDTFFDLSSADSTCSICLFRVYGSGLSHMLNVAPLLNYFGGRHNADIPGYRKFFLSFLLKCSAIFSVLFLRCLTMRQLPSFWIHCNLFVRGHHVTDLLSCCLLAN
jgi:MFS family permease